MHESLHRNEGKCTGGAIELSGGDRLLQTRGLGPAGRYTPAGPKSSGLGRAVNAYVTPVQESPVQRASIFWP
jgi:hypothetical protein